MKRKRKDKPKKELKAIKKPKPETAEDLGEPAEETPKLETEGTSSEPMTKKNKRKKKGLSKGDNRDCNKPSTNLKVEDPFTPVEITRIPDIDTIKTRDVQALALFFLGCTQAPPEWCFVSNRGAGRRVCCIMIEALYPYVYSSMKHNMPNFQKLFPDGPMNLENPGADLYVTPASSQILEKEPKSRKYQAPQSPEPLPSVQYYILAEEHRMAHEYPMVEILAKEPTWKRFTGNVAVKTSSQFPLYAVDCEMCRTQEGQEATQIAIVDESLNCIYKTYIKPANPITDYLTQWSGITADIMKDVTTTLAEVIKHVNDILPPHAVFVGHSFENDLRALKMYHDKVIDTATIYSSGKGGSFKPGLKFLAEKHLKAKIQCSMSGHDPSEDAMACMRLVKLKIKRGPKYGYGYPGSDNSLSVYLTAHRKSGVFIDRPIVVQQHCNGTAQSIPAVNDKIGTDSLIRRLSSTAEFFWYHMYRLDPIYRASSTVHDMINNTALAQQLKDIDTDIQLIYQHMPGDMLLLVFSGCSGYWKKPEFNGSDEAISTMMKSIVANVRKGVFFMKVK